MPLEDSQHGVTQAASLGLTVSLVVTALAGGMALGAANLQAEDPIETVTAVQEVPDGPPLVRFVHASPDTLPVNVTINNETVLTNVPVGNVSDYLRVTNGNHTITVTIARTSTEGEVLFEEDLNVERETNYTVILTGEWTVSDEGSVRPVILEDIRTAPSENESSIRMSHFSPNAPAVDVTLQGTDRVLFDNVSLENSTDYVSVPAGNHTLEVREAAPDASGDIITTVNVTLDGGDAYSAFAIGYLEPEAAIADTPFDLVIAGPTISEPSPQTMITPTPEGTPVETPTPTDTPTNETDA